MDCLIRRFVFISRAGVCCVPFAAEVCARCSGADSGPSGPDQLWKEGCCLLSLWAGVEGAGAGVWGAGASDGGGHTRLSDSPAEDGRSDR